MKHLLYILPLLFFCAACEDDDGTQLPTGDPIYRLSEVYYDPGDGSGDFESIDSPKEIVFLNDSTISVTGTLCSLNDSDGAAVIYSLNTAEQIIEDDCGGWRQISYDKTEEVLNLSFPCIEGCIHRYRRVNL